MGRPGAAPVARECSWGSEFGMGLYLPRPENDFCKSALGFYCWNETTGQKKCQSFGTRLIGFPIEQAHLIVW